MFPAASDDNQLPGSVCYATLGLQITEEKTLRPALMELAAIRLRIQLLTSREELFKWTVTSSSTNGQLKGASSTRSVWALGLLFMLYVGGEITAGGKFVTITRPYIRHPLSFFQGELLSSLSRCVTASRARSATVASGIWGGLALGRLPSSRSRARSASRAWSSSISPSASSCSSYSG